MSKNLEKIGLSLAPRKTTLVEFSRYGFCDNRLFIKVKGIKIYNKKETKFLGIWLDNRFKFDRQVKETRGKVKTANSILRYLSNVTRGVEVNTGLMLYKSLMRSIIDYGIYIYIPKDLNLALKLERGQFLGLRTALGYRNNTPNNVILAEAKIVLLRERMLAKNLCSKIYKYGEENISISLKRLRTGERYKRFRNPVLGKVYYVKHGNRCQE